MSMPPGGDDEGPRTPGTPPEPPPGAAPPPAAEVDAGADTADATADGDGEEDGGAEIIAWPGRKRGTEPEGPPASDAEDLVVKALSSITGRDPADLLRELRAREAAERAEGQGESRRDGPSGTGKVIDLGAVRAARERAHQEGGAELGGVAREAFRAVMDALARLQPQGGELVIDRDFVRAHGPTLLGSVLETVGKALLGRDDEATDASPAPAAEPMEDTDDAQTGEVGAQPEGSADEVEAIPETVASPPRPVEVRFDLGSLAIGLLSRLGMFRGTVRAESSDDAVDRQAKPRDAGDDAPEDPEGT